MNRTARTIACSAGVAGAALLGAPAQAAPTVGVSATPNITAVTDGTTVSFDFSLTGTQHNGTGPGHTTVKAPGVLSFSADYGDGKGGTGGDAGAVGCSSTGVSPLADHMPATYTYAKPGTYKVKVDFWYCGDANDSHVTKTIDVTVGSKPSPAGTGAIKPTMSTSLMPSVKGNVLTYSVVSEGVQRFVAENGGTPYANKTATGYDVDFGDGHHDAGNGTGGATCTNVGADPVYSFQDDKKHVYAKPGTYTVTATTYYCGDGGQKASTSSSVVKIGAAGQTIPAPKPTHPTSGTTSSGTTSTRPGRAPASAMTGTGTSTTGMGTTGTHTTAQTPAGTATSTGPKVNTDGDSGSRDAMLYTGIGGAAALAAGGGLVVARRRQH